jgi:chromosome segregation ATPase
MRDLRARETRVRQGELAGVIDDARSSAADVAAGVQRLENLRTVLADTARRRAQALAAGDARIAKIAQLEQFAARVRRELDAAHGELARAEARHAGQLAEVDAARHRLARARADREVIDRHFARWRAERARLAENREE